LPGTHPAKNAAWFVRERRNVVGLILLILLIVLLFGAVPAWPYSRGWGYRPTGIVGLLLIVVVILLLTGNL
jgi:hypothetical protein